MRLALCRLAITLKGRAASCGAAFVLAHSMAENPELQAVLDRLRRVVDDGEAPVAMLSGVILQAYADRIGPEQALLLERWMTCVAAAAEELGQDADQQAILRRAREIEAQLS
jgi:hypothetical protein